MDCTPYYLVSGLIILVSWALAFLVTRYMRGPGLTLQVLLWLVSIVTLIVLTVILVVHLAEGTC